MPDKENEPRPPGIDLQAHTTASDGSASPTEVVTAAARLGLAAIAVTDHDTIGGLAEAIEAARANSIEFVPGVELSVEDDIGRFHLLGYLFDPADAKLAETLVQLRISRNERNQQIMERARELNLPITWNDVREQAGEDAEVIARPHIAAALLKRGVVSTRQEAFDIYLTPGKPLYFPKMGLTPAEAAQILHSAGGVAVMAHPGLSKWADPGLLAERLAGLKDNGLDGVEVYYSQHTPEQTAQYLEIARDLGMIYTGGSDYHGDPKPHVHLGVVYEGGPAPAEILGPLKERAQRYK
ncbi:MAG TPA: PHP domain-containing protein [Capsulimonadaceae bacterium]|nr:PHP domain-containing protein [Capsulimonadaceae bacterium]